MLVKGKPSPMSLVAEPTLLEDEPQISVRLAPDVERAEPFSTAWRGNPRVLGRSSTMSLVAEDHLLVTEPTTSVMPALDGATAEGTSTAWATRDGVAGACGLVRQSRESMTQAGSMSTVGLGLTRGAVAVVPFLTDGETGEALARAMTPLMTRTFLTVDNGVGGPVSRLTAVWGMDGMGKDVDG
jgi:hypothetical protein